MEVEKLTKEHSEGSGTEREGLISDEKRRHRVKETVFSTKAVGESREGQSSKMSEEEQLKIRIFHHISNPIVRGRADGHGRNCRQRCPWKMSSQLIKMLVALVQVILVTKDPVSNRSMFRAEIQDVFSNLLCQPQPHIVPESRGNPNNIYTYYLYAASDLEDILDRVDNLFFLNLSTLLGAYNYSYDEKGIVRPIEISLTKYSQSVQKPFQYDGALNTSGGKSIFEQVLDLCGGEDCFQRLQSMQVRFFLTNVRMIQPGQVQRFAITITLSVILEGGGRLQLTLTADQKCIECDYQSPDKIIFYAVMVVSCTVLPLCLISFGLSIIACFKSCILAKDMKRFYKNHLNQELTCSQCMPGLFQYWHFIIMLGDLVVLCGTTLNIAQNFSPLHFVEIMRVLLGIGIVLQTAAILRYISYFEQFNVLFSALAVAFPRLLKFLLCAGILFVSFMLCGWVALGPFHYKFSEVDSSFYTLFSMLNGDDLWNTYTGMSPKDDLGIFVFSQIFFTVFLLLFICAVLNLFVTVIIRSYEDSQKPQLNDEVHNFTFSGPLTNNGATIKDMFPKATTSYVDPEIVMQRAAPEVNDYHRV